MPDLNTLMSMNGAIAAFRFSDQGILEEHQIVPGSVIDAAALDLLAHVCIANLSIATMQARGWEKISGQGGFYPINGFSVIGLEWSAVAQGNHGVVLDNAKADYQTAFNLLSGDKSA
jgi:roadblock/LC7 domain-containing protein